MTIPKARRALFRFILLCPVPLLLLNCASARTAAPSGIRASGDPAPAVPAADPFASALKIRRPVRVAVLDFIPTQKDHAGKSDFGRFYCEKLTGDLSRRKEDIRIFERKRLDAIVEEHTLQLTDMVDADEAREFGNLAPIDYLVTGTYTLFPSSVSVNGRIVDVVTGEIAGTLDSSIALTDDLKAFFMPQPVPKPETVYYSRRDSCEERTAPVIALMEDLTTPDKIDGLVGAAVVQPFDTLCGFIHSRILHLFERHQLNPPVYRAFLIKSLESIETPDNDHRGLDIVSYFSKVGTVGDAEWRAGLAVLSKSATYTHSYVDYLIYNPFQAKGDFGTATKRIDEVMALARKGQIGRPLPLSFDRVFSGVFSGLGIHSSDSDSRCALYLYEKYQAGLSPEAVRKQGEYLESMYFREKDLKARQALLNHVAWNFNAAGPDKALAQDLLDFLRKLDKADPSPAADLSRFAKECAPAVSRSFTLIPFASQRDDAIELCIRFGLSAPGLIPTVEELGTLLFSDTPAVQMNAAKHLGLYGVKAAPIGKKVLKLLRRSERLNYSGTTNLRWSLISVLGNIRTQDPEALDMLTELLSSTDYCVPDSAVAALVKIGEPAVPVLKKAYDSAETSVQIRIVRVFEKRGPSAAPHTAFLKGLLATAQNGHLRDALEDAVEKLSR